MLPFFTEPYQDELLYSAISRYHFYSCNIDCKDTLEELFQNRNVIPSIEIGSHLNILSKQIGANCSVQDLLLKHTIYPFYAPFLSQNRQLEILKDVQNDGKGLYTRLGMVAGSICKKNGLFYCPICAQEDIKKYGEPFIHREHQLQGINLCAHHHIQLKKYKIDMTMKSRTEYIRFERKNLNLFVLKKNENSNYYDIEVKLAELAYEIINLGNNKLSREQIIKKYRLLLSERDLITPANHVRQKDLFKAFREKFPKGFLEKYDSELVIDDEYNWLKVLTRNSKRHVHPFRQLLFLYFLDQDSKFFTEMSEDGGPFGTGFWPCLNKAADHYRELVISNVTITRDFKSISPIGTFECSCGFIYARKGPDKRVEDKYHIGRVKQFGEIWEARLHLLTGEGNHSIRELGRLLGVDSKTIKKYQTFKKSVKTEKGVNKKKFPMLNQYKKDILDAIQLNPTYSRTQIRAITYKQYTYLYTNDKEWLYKNLPEHQKKTNLHKRIDWNLRDQIYYKRIRQLVKELLCSEKPVRITRSLIGKRLGIQSSLENKREKIPCTQKYLDENTETIQQFQIRRCCKIIDKMLKKREEVLMWKVQRIGGVKSHDFREIKPCLEDYQKIQEGIFYDKKTI